MKTAVLQIIVILFASVSLSAQYIPDDEFEWLIYPECLSGFDDPWIFKVVEESPRLLMSKSELEKFMSNQLQHIISGEDASGYIKLKVLFLLDSSICLHKIGQSVEMIKSDQLVRLREEFSNIGMFEAGKQRGIPKHCEGIFYIELSRGKLKSLSVKNIELK